jgi:serine/threonine-protein kinase
MWSQRLLVAVDASPAAEHVAEAAASIAVRCGLPLTIATVAAHDSAVERVKADAVVAKAMAKALDDRYQTVKELADDLREVRRQLDASRPAHALKARSAPPPARSAGDVAADTSSRPVSADGRLDKGSLNQGEAARPLEIAKTFDSFDATLRLAAMTNQTAEFEEYISETQKMRAYRGKIEAGSPLAPVAPPPPAEPEQEVPRFQPMAGFATQAPPAEEPPPFPEGESSSMPALVAIIVLSIAAIGLLVTLLVK